MQKLPLELEQKLPEEIRLIRQFYFQSEEEKEKVMRVNENGEDNLSRR
jgi:ABC-type proline/glycine betaine transport system substrate-binding protein